MANGESRAEDELLTAVIHDIRRHLRTAVGRAQMIERESIAELTVPLRAHLASIVSAGREMNLLLTRLAQYAVAGRKKENQPHGDVGVMFDSALRHLAQRNNDAEIDSDPIRKSGIQAPYPIEIVLRELLDNALKFRKGPVKISVLVEQSPESHIFGIKDSGIGFDTQYSERIMLPLERLHPPDAYEGCGLGLAICRRTIEALDGRLWAESNLNVGSTFWFSVPA
jgi:light-regulated signal transduction histidine kinase (bacteriophytochrome)